MGYPPGSKLGISSCALPSPYTVYPQLTLDLLAYQDQVCKFSRKFKASAWLMYDTAFRYMAASSATMAWAKVNEQLYNDILKEETLPYCINCHAYGHRTLACSMRSTSAQSFHPYSATSTTGQSQTFTSTPIQPTRPSHSSKEPSAMTSTVVPVPISPPPTLGTSATNQIAEETTLAPSALKYPLCNPTPLSLSPPSTQVNIMNLTAELKHHPYQQYTASLLHDLQWGCNIGCTGPRFAKITPNLKSVHL